MKMIGLITKMAKIAVTATLIVLSSSCNTDELCYDHPHVGETTVVFDWSRCPDAQPASMAAYFFTPAREEHIRYNFAGRDGGKINLPYDSYNALGLNSDHTNWARMRNVHDVEAFEIYTEDVTTLRGLGLDVRSLPAARADKEQRMAKAPEGALYNHRLDGIAVNESTEGQTVTFYPEEATCRYTVTVTDVENIKYLHGSPIDGTLSGMAEGFCHGTNSPTSTPVTMPYLLVPDEAANTLRSSFITFGRPDDASVSHTATIYVLFEDGTAQYYTYDVSDQVLDAPDPHRVDIVIKGIRLPKPIVNGGGFKPDVSQWTEQREEIKM